MNNVEHLFSSLKGFVKNTLNKTNIPDYEYSQENMNDKSQVGATDREEDGFLVVGETRSEKMAVRTCQFNSECGLYAPPTYSQVSPPDEELPTYRVAMERGMSITETHQSAEVPVLNHNHDNLLPISGVPFVLAPLLAVQYEIIQSDLCSENFIPRTFSLSKYQYDFNFERSYLRDNCGYDCDVSQIEVTYSGEDLIQL